MNTFAVRAGVLPTNPPAGSREHARLLVSQAQVWLRHVLEHAGLMPDRVAHKTLESLFFTLGVESRSLAIPSKLVGTRAAQAALQEVRLRALPKGAPLTSTITEDRVLVAYEGMLLGEVQRKHTPWLRPLLPLGASVHLLRVTGSGDERWLGCNVAFAHVAEAIEKLNAPSGDGAQGVPQIAAAEDILLWRESDGTARCSISHAIRHSPTGIEWGYGGSGPADLARSILLRFTDPPTADRWYQDYKREVVAQIPPRGGQIKAASVVSWLSGRTKTA